MHTTPPLTADRLLTSLDRSQREAAADTSRRFLIRAPAGSGKTRTLTARIVRAVRLAGVEPASVVALTFTRSAAREMRERLRESLGTDAADAIWVGTLHAYALGLIARSARENDDVLLRPCTDDEAVEILRSLFKGATAVPLPGCTEADLRRLVRRVTREGLGILDDAAPAVLAAMLRFLTRLHDLRIIPWGLSVPVVELLPSFRQMIAHVRALFVDEAQDLSPIEHAFVAAHDGAALTYVADQAQAIYGWRGADGLDAATLCWPTVWLDRVYRFGHEIARHSEPAALNGGRGLDVVTTDAAHVDHAEVLPNPLGLGVEAITAEAISRAEDLAATILERLPSVAVLCRTRAMAEKIAASGIATLVQAPTSPVLDLAVALCRVAMAPSDDASTGRVLTLCGWHPDAVARVRLEAGRRRSLLDELRLPAYGSKADRGVSALLDLPLRDDAAETPFGLVWALAARALDSIDADVGTWLAREAILDLGIPEALEALTGEAMNEGRGWDALAHTGAVGVGTIHGAKGREWDAVVVVRDAPLERIQGEEWRVLHVAQTRARRVLIEVEVEPIGWRS